MSRETCERCGSVYEVEYHKAIMRDRDQIACDVCGHVLREWNGACYYTAVLVERGSVKDSTAN